jgi:uncharacterized OB-fold protein
VTGRPFPIYDNPYDAPFWEFCRGGELRLQACRRCGEFQFPAGPICSRCLSHDLGWEPLSGRGTVLSWVRFHRQYYPEFPPPYICLSVELEEGPLLITNPVPEYSGPDPVVGQSVLLEVRHFDNTSLPLANLLSGAR